MNMNMHNDRNSFVKGVVSELLSDRIEVARVSFPEIRGHHMGLDTRKYYSYMVPRSWGVAQGQKLLVNGACTGLNVTLVKEVISLEQEPRTINQLRWAVMSEDQMLGRWKEIEEANRELDAAHNEIHKRVRKELMLRFVDSEVHCSVSRVLRTLEDL